MADQDQRVRPPKQRPFDVQAFLRSGGVSAKIVERPKGQVIYSQGDPCDTIFYIQ